MTDGDGLMLTCQACGVVVGVYLRRIARQQIRYCLLLGILQCQFWPEKIKILHRFNLIQDNTMHAVQNTAFTPQKTVSFLSTVDLSTLPYASSQYKENALAQLQDQLNHASSPEEFELMLGQMKLGLAGDRTGDPKGIELFQHIFENRAGTWFPKKCTESGSMALVAYTLKIFGKRILDHNNQIDTAKRKMAMNMLFGNKMPEIEGDLAKVHCIEVSKGVYQLSTKKYQLTLTESLHNDRGSSIHGLIRQQDVYKPFFYNKTIEEVMDFIGPGVKGASDLPPALSNCVAKKDRAKLAIGDETMTGMKTPSGKKCPTIEKAFDKGGLAFASRLQESTIDRFDAAAQRMAKGMPIYSSKVETHLSIGKKITQDIDVRFIGDSGSSELSKSSNRKIIATPMNASWGKFISPGPGHLDLPTSVSTTQTDQPIDDGMTGFPRDGGFFISSVLPAQGDPKSADQLLQLPNTVYAAKTRVCINDDGRDFVIVDRTTYNLGSQYGGTAEENAARAYKALDYVVKDFMLKYPNAGVINFFESRLLNGIVGVEKGIFRQNQEAFNTAVAKYNEDHGGKPTVKYVSAHVEAHQANLHGPINGAEAIGEMLPDELQELTPNLIKDFGDVTAMQKEYEKHFALMESGNQTRYRQVMNKWVQLSHDLMNMNNAIAYLALTAILTDALNEDKNLDARGIKFIDPFGCKSAKDRTTCGFEGAIKILMVLIKLEMEKENPNINRFFNEDGTFQYEALSPAEKTFIDDTFDPDYTHIVSGIGTNVPSNKNPGTLLTFFKHVPCIKNSVYHIAKTDD